MGTTKIYKSKYFNWHKINTRKPVTYNKSEQKSVMNL